MSCTSKCHSLGVRGSCGRAEASQQARLLCAPQRRTGTPIAFATQPPWRGQAVATSSAPQLHTAGPGAI
eukprot:364521-Chlamydomonas_euryale.AAC.10